MLLRVFSLFFLWWLVSWLRLRFHFFFFFSFPFSCWLLFSSAILVDLGAQLTAEARHIKQPPHSTHFLWLDSQLQYYFFFLYQIDIPSSILHWLELLSRFVTLYIFALPNFVAFRVTIQTATFSLLRQVKKSRNLKSGSVIRKIRCTQ